MEDCVGEYGFFAEYIAKKVEGVLEMPSIRTDSRSMRDSEDSTIVSKKKNRNILRCLFFS